MNIYFITLFFTSIGTILSQEIVSIPIKPQLKYSIISEQCLSVLDSSAWFDTSCTKDLTLKVMGYCVIITAALTKFPQIAKIIKNKSTLGVSFGDIVLDASTQLSAVAYNMNQQNPFSIYGERFMVAIQMMFVAVLFIVYSNKKTGYPIRQISGLGIIIIIFWAAVNPIYFPKYILDNILIAQIILFAAARLCQIFQIHRLKSTGSLSGITYTLNCSVNIGRLVTSFVQLPNDTYFRWSVSSALLLNLYVVACFFIFCTPKHIQGKQKDY